MIRHVVLVLAVLVFLPAVSGSYVIDRVEAVVNGEVITRSEVDRAVKSEAMRRGVSDEAGLSGLRKEVLDSLIERELILGDARKFNIVDVSEKEVDDALASVKARYPSEDEFIKALSEEDMTLDELREDLAGQLTVLKYIDRRVRFFVRVTLDDQKRYYREHQEDFAGEGFNDVHDRIYSILMEKYTDEKLKEYLDELRSRSEIIVVTPSEGG